jgi:hypothetical protein
MTSFAFLNAKVVRRICREVAQELQADCVASTVYEMKNGVCIVICSPLPFLDLPEARELAIEVMHTIAESLAYQHNGSVMYMVKRTSDGSYKTGVFVNVKQPTWCPDQRFYEPPTLAVGDPNRFN